MSGIFDATVKFLGSHSIEDKVLHNWKIMFADKLAEKLFAQVSKTLQSVKTIEESLKRFKKKRVVDGPSDEDKIRMQIKLDVEAFGKEVI